MVSSKNGPSSGSGLSKSASVWSPPAMRSPSSATPRPGANSSTSSARGGPSGGAGVAEGRGGLAPPRHEEPLERDLAAGDELLDEQRAGGLAAHGDVVAPEERGDAPEGGDELVRAVRADHAPARRERPRLQHARVGRAGGRARRVLRERARRDARARA